MVELGVTLFSNVITRSPPIFTLKEGYLDLYFKEGEKVGVLMVSGRPLRGVFKVSGS